MRIWTREETIIAFNLYCKIPFNRCNKSHPLVVKYSKIIGRTPDALNMKIGNIGRLDPDLKKKGITGLGHGAKAEEEVWNEFYGNPEQLAFESERLIAKFSNATIEDSLQIDLSNLPEGADREVVIKQRVNQSFFRSAVMGSYDYRCCISGISLPSLVEACHIVDWAEDKVNRTNPKNGLCLNSFFHKAYDNYLISITPVFKIVISEELIGNILEESTLDYIKQFDGKDIHLPDRFVPSKDLLDIHHQKFLSSI